MAADWCMTAVEKASVARVSFCVGAAAFATGPFLLCTCPGWFFFAAVACGVAGMWGTRPWGIAGLGLCIASLLIAGVQFQDERKQKTISERFREKMRERVEGLPPYVPVTFLSQAGLPIEALQTPVSGTFQATPARDVVMALCGQARVNYNYSGNVEGRPAPTFSGTFTEVSLRAALFEVAYRTHIHVRWDELPEGAKFLSVSE